MIQKHLRAVNPGGGGPPNGAGTVPMAYIPVESIPTTAPPAPNATAANPHVPVTPSGANLPSGMPGAPPPGAQPAAPFRFDTPDTPPELKGKTPTEVLAIYSALREHYRRTATQPVGQPPANAPTTQPTAQPQPTTRQPARTPTTGPDAEFWADPAGFIQRSIAAAVQPLITTNVTDQVVRIQDNLATTLPGYDQVENRVLEIMATVPQESHTNPKLWEQAYTMAVGERFRAGNPINMAPAQPTPQPNVQPPGPTRIPVSNIFTEGPSAPAAGSTPLTAEAQHLAGRFGMTPQQWTEWDAIVRGTSR